MVCWLLGHVITSSCCGKVTQLSLKNFTRLRYIGRDGEQIPRLTTVSASCKAVGGLCLDNHEHIKRTQARVCNFLWREQPWAWGWSGGIKSETNWVFSLQALQWTGFLELKIYLAWNSFLFWAPIFKYQKSSTTARTVHLTLWDPLVVKNDSRLTGAFQTFYSEGTGKPVGCEELFMQSWAQDEWPPRKASALRASL